MGYEIELCAWEFRSSGVDGVASISHAVSCSERAAFKRRITFCGLNGISPAALYALSMLDGFIALGLAMR